MAQNLSFREKLIRFIKKTKKKTDRQVMIIAILLIVFMFGFLLISRPGREIELKDNGPKPLLTATMFGDIMLGRNVERITDKAGKKHIFRFMTPYLQKSDFVTANFEHPVTESNVKIDKNIHLKTQRDSIEALKKMNFTVLNLANNHMNDFSQEGVQDTIEAFHDYNLAFVGAGKDSKQAKQIFYKMINGKKIATLGFTDVYNKGSWATEDRSGVATTNPKVTMSLIEQAKATADLVIVNVHWGTEYDSVANSRQRELAKAMAEAGADIIVGHHPHVLQSIERYKNTMIFYSLGNFVFDQGWSNTKETAMVQFKWEQDGSKRFEIIPLLIKEASPRPIGRFDFYHRGKILRQLTKEMKDVPWHKEGNKLIINIAN